MRGPRDTVGRRVRLLVAVVVLATPVLGLPGLPGVPGGGRAEAADRYELVQPGLAGRRRFALVGDSLSVAVGWYTSAYQRFAPLPLRVDAEVGRTTAQAVGVLPALRLGEVDVLIAALGTNDPAAGYGTTLDRFLGAVPRRVQEVWWVLPARHSAAMDTVRAEIAGRAAADPRLRLLDWDAYQAAHPDWVAGDGVHLTTAGYQARGRMLQVLAHDRARVRGPVRALVGSRRWPPTSARRSRAAPPRSSARPRAGSAGSRSTARSAATR